MRYSETGRIIKGVGGLYTVRLSSGQTPLSGRTVYCRARGGLRAGIGKPYIGDYVSIAYSEQSFTVKDGVALPKDDTDTVIESIAERRNFLERPPVANIDYLILTCAAAAPAPAVGVIDRILCICERRGIEPIVIIGKRELAPEYAESLRRIYTLAGYTCFTLSAKLDEGTEELRAFVREHLSGKTAVFAGASGVGKSTLMNLIFPTLSLETGEVSRKTERGRHTTRTVEIFELPGDIMIADTPGFSLLDFERTEALTLDELPMCMREFPKYLSECRYTDCTHTGETECGIYAARMRGEISQERHESYKEIYRELKSIPKWGKK